MTAKVIYEPKGRALEYSGLAANLYKGCYHGCRYCYAPGVLRMKPAVFHFQPGLRSGVMEQLEKDAVRMSGDMRMVLLSFTADP